MKNKLFYILIFVCISLIVAEIILNLTRETSGSHESTSIKRNTENKTIELDSIDWENVTTSEEMIEEE